MARPERLELPTLWFEARCSIQLSYGRILGNSIIFTLLRGCVKLWRRRNFWSVWSNISRNIETNTNYFRFTESLFEFFIHARIEFGHCFRLVPHPKIVDVLLAALPS
jgi:hypothetical protein